jgi:hypothetical protein
MRLTGYLRILKRLEPNYCPSSDWQSVGLGTKFSLMLVGASKTRVKVAVRFFVVCAYTDLPWGQVRQVR